MRRTAMEPASGSSKGRMKKREHVLTPKQLEALQEARDAREVAHQATERATALFRKQLSVLNSYGFSNRKIAGLLGVSANAVNKEQHRVA